MCLGPCHIQNFNSFQVIFWGVVQLKLNNSLPLSCAQVLIYAGEVKNNGILHPCVFSCKCCVRYVGPEIDPAQRMNYCACTHPPETGNKKDYNIM
jgi:hypothetical protein